MSIPSDPLATKEEHADLAWRASAGFGAASLAMIGVSPRLALAAGYLAAMNAIQGAWNLQWFPHWVGFLLHVVLLVGLGWTGHLIG